jgi:hypothetical protein
MAKTGPQKIPGASLAYFYGTGQYSGSDMEVNCGVVHTTEGRTLPSYNGGAIAPTVTGVPDISAKRIRWYQHYDVDESARALANKLGGVQTNTANVFQIELVGTCDPKARDAWVRAGHRQNVDFIFWPEAPDWALAEVAWLVRWLHDEHGVPLTCVRDWLAYGVDARRPGVVPASYGASPARMSHAEWQAFKGWCGHQHVPENDHGDPGSMDFARVIAQAKGAGAEEDDMPTTDEIVKAIATKDGHFGVPARWREDNPTNDKWKLESVLAYIGDRALDTGDAVEALAEKVGTQKPVELTDAQVQAIAEKVAAAPSLAEAIASRVAELLADRLAE